MKTVFALFAVTALAAMLTACPTQPDTSLKPQIASFTATPSSLPAVGGSLTLAWNVTGASSLSIDQGVGAVTGSSKVVNVAANTTFTLTATNANGPSTATAAVSLSPALLYADSALGQDSNPGTIDKPFKTIKQALTVVTAGQTIVLNPGIYDGASGETWAYKIPDKVIIKANSSGVVLSSASGQDAFAFLGDGEIRYLTFKGFGQALRANKGTQKIIGASVEGKRGLNWSGDASASLEDCVFQTTETALQASYTSHLEILNGKLASTSNNLIVQQLARVSIKGTTITGGTIDLNQTGSLSLENVKLSNVRSYAIYVRAGAPFLNIKGGSFSNSSQQADVILLEQGTVNIDGAAFTGNGTAIGASAGSVTLRNSTISNNTSYGITIGKGVAFKMRGSTVGGNAYGLSISDASGGIDLGTASDPGGNTITDNRNYSNSFGANISGGWQGTGTVQAVGNTWNPNLQGTNAAGHYPSQLLTCAGSYPTLTLYNSYCSSGASIQF